MTSTPLISLILIIYSANATAVPTADPVNTQTLSACWEEEIDPNTERSYQSHDLYLIDLAELKDSAPPRPGFLSLIRGYQISKKEEAYSSNMNSDKGAHCYLGCMISSKVGKDVAYYAGWYKEHNDATDCHSKTRFDWFDLEATKAGAVMGTQITNQQDARPFCQTSCEIF